AYVLALGSYSPRLARPLGIDLPIYPLKGYSVTMPVRNPAAAWTVSLSDEAHKLVLSRMGDRLRIAGTAELDGYNTQINKVRCDAIVKRVMALFPDAGDPSRAEYWAGLRPATPTNLPCIGFTKYPNLFLNTGHGTLGWTHACGSGRILADLVSGRQPEIEL
ncbi:MAG: FAD-dependent oxidoreductase, partial [Bradyrhizobium sp.]